MFDFPVIVKKNETFTFLPLFKIKNNTSKKYYSFLSTYFYTQNHPRHFNRLKYRKNIYIYTYTFKTANICAILTIIKFNLLHSLYFQINFTPISSTNLQKYLIVKILRIRARAKLGHFRVQTRKVNGNQAAVTVEYKIGRRVALVISGLQRCRVVGYWKRV